MCVCERERVIGGGGETKQGGKWRETKAGLAGTRGREIRGPTPTGSPPLHPASLAPGPEPVPARTFQRLLFWPVCSAKARAGDGEAQRLQGQESWGPLAATTASEVTCERLRLPTVYYTYAFSLIWAVHGTLPQTMSTFQPDAAPVSELDTEGHGERSPIKRSMNEGRDNEHTLGDLLPHRVWDTPDLASSTAVSVVQALAL